MRLTGVTSRVQSVASHAEKQPVKYVKAVQGIKHEGLKGKEGLNPSNMTGAKQQTARAQHSTAQRREGSR